MLAHPRPINLAGLLHATPPEHLFDALLRAFHVATTPLVAGWHLGLLVGMPDDPRATAKGAIPSSAGGSGAGPSGITQGGWPLVPSRALVVYQTYNQVLRLAQELKMEQMVGLPPVPVMDLQPSGGQEDAQPQQGVNSSVGTRVGAPPSPAAAAAAAAQPSGSDESVPNMGLRRTRRRLATASTQTSAQDEGAAMTAAGDLENTSQQPIGADGEGGKPLLASRIRHRLADGQTQGQGKEDSSDVGRDQQQRPGLSADGAVHTLANAGMGPAPIGGAEGGGINGSANTEGRPVPSGGAAVQGGVALASPYMGRQQQQQQPLQGAAQGPPQIAAAPPSHRLQFMQPPPPFPTVTMPHHHPGMTGGPALQQLPPQPGCNPLPPGISFEDLANGYSLPAWSQVRLPNKLGHRGES